MIRDRRYGKNVWVKYEYRLLLSEVSNPRREQLEFLRLLLALNKHA